MSQSIRISNGFGPTLQHIPSTCIFESNKHTLGFPILSVKKCRNRGGWISVSNNRNPRPLFLLYATLKDEEEGGTLTGVISTVVQRFCKMLGSYFSDPPLKPGSKPPSVFELWQDVMKIMETARSFEDMEQALLMASGSVEGMKSEAKVDNISEPARKIVNHITGKEMLCITGLEMLRRKRSIVQITTGSQALDELLGGGIGTMAITETFGESGSGRSLLAHTLCVTTQLPTNMHGGNGKVAFIDTQGTFRPDRIVPIAERFGMDAGAVMDNIEYVRAYTYEDQYNFLLGLVTKISKESTIRLLIVDSVIALIRDLELAKSQEKLIEMLSFLKIITQEFNVAVYVINQLIAEPGEGIMSISDEPEPAGGRTMAELAKIRLMFSKGKGEQRVCRLYKDPTTCVMRPKLFSR